MNRRAVTPRSLVGCCSCGALVERQHAFQVFVCLDSCKRTGGSRQKSMAGRHLERYFCGPCADSEDAKAKRGTPPQETLLDA